jgi:cell division protein ZapA
LAQVAITLDGRVYRLGCEDGQEERLQALANYVSGKLENLSEEFGQIGDPRLFLMCALVIADELFDARAGANGRSRARPSVDASGEPVIRQARASLQRRTRAIPEPAERPVEVANVSETEASS